MSDAHWFTSRKRARIECSRCYGTGRITVGFAIAPADVPARGAPPDAIHACVVGCSTIFEACREAAAIARRSDRPVAFEFNEHCVVVLGCDDPDTIARMWWIKAYGETPEQSARRR